MPYNIASETPNLTHIPSHWATTKIYIDVEEILEFLPVEELTDTEQDAFRQSQRIERAHLSHR